MNPELMKQLQQATDENLMAIETAKEEGRSAIGFYCLYSPTEIAVAADAIPCPFAVQETIRSALPRRFSPGTSAL